VTAVVADRGRAVLANVLRDRVSSTWPAEGRISAIWVRTHSGRQVHVRVSTRTSGDWQSSKKWRDAGARRDPARLWAFVTVTADGQLADPGPLLAYEADAMRAIDDEVQEWFERNGHADPAVKDSGHCAITVKRVRTFARDLAGLLT